MEALVFMFNSLVMIAVVVMGLRDDRRPAGSPQTSLFRTTGDDSPRVHTPGPSSMLGDWERPEAGPPA